MNWLMANWQTLAIAILAVAEVLSLFIKGNGTIQGLIAFLIGLPGVKDPKIGS